jgi:hypothetical protein
VLGRGAATTDSSTLCACTFRHDTTLADDRLPIVTGSVTESTVSGDLDPTSSPMPQPLRRPMRARGDESRGHRYPIESSPSRGYSAEAGAVVATDPVSTDADCDNGAALRGPRVDLEGAMRVRLRA